MRFFLKTLFMKRIIGAKQKKQPFDYEAGEAFVLPADADATVNNSYYFSAHSVEGESLYCRLGLRAPHSEVWFAYCRDGRLYTHTPLLYKDKPPLSVSRTEEGWEVIFDGPLAAEDGSEIAATFRGLFTSQEAPVDFFSHMPPVRTAKAMAGEKWSREFFAEVQKNNQVHYEQTGRLRGHLTLGDEEREIDLPCVRDHSFGKRVWGYMNNHLWLMAVNNTSQLNFSMVSYPAMTLLEVGNFKPAEGEMCYLLSAEYDRAAAVTGEVPRELSLTLRMTGGRVLTVTATCEFSTEYLFEGGDYRLLEGIGSFEINGVRYRGIIEVGVNGCRERIYNNRTIDELRA